MVSAYAAPKWPEDYGEEKGLFYHTWLFNRFEGGGGPKMIPTSRQVAALNA